MSQKDGRLLGLTGAQSLAGALPSMKRSQLYNSKELTNGITQFRNDNHRTQLRDVASISVHKMLIELIQYKIYELALAFITIVVFYLCYYDFDDNNIKKNPKKSSIVVDLCLEQHVVSQVPKHKKSCNLCIILHKIIDPTIDAVEYSNNTTVVIKKKITNKQKLRKDVTITIDLSTVFQDKKYHEIKECIFEIHSLVSDCLQPTKGHKKAPQDKFNAKIKPLRRLIEKLTNIYNKLLNEMDKNAIDSKCRYKLSPIDKSSLIKEVSVFRDENRDSGVFNTQLIDQLLLNRRGLTTSYEKMKPQLKSLAIKYEKDIIGTSVNDNCNKNKDEQKEQDKENAVKQTDEETGKKKSSATDYDTSINVDNVNGNINDDKNDTFNSKLDNVNKVEVDKQLFGEIDGSIVENTMPIIKGFTNCGENDNSHIDTSSTINIDNCYSSGNILARTNSNENQYRPVMDSKSTTFDNRILKRTLNNLNDDTVFGASIFDDNSNKSREKSALSDLNDIHNDDNGNDYDNSMIDSLIPPLKRRKIMQNVNDKSSQITINVLHNPVEFVNILVHENMASARMLLIVFCLFVFVVFFCVCF